MSEYEAVVKAVDTIMSFLYTHEKSSTTSMWESDIDGTTLKTDWGYFEQGLNEIKWYCTELESNVMPSADRPQGEWLAVSSYDAFGGSEELWNAHGNPTAFHYCSKCKAQSYVNEFGEELLTDYCPNCGARMRK